MVQCPVGRALGSGKSCTPHMRVRVHSRLSSSFAEVGRVPAVGDEQLVSAIPFGRQLDGQVQRFESAEALSAARAAGSAAP